MLYKEIGFLVNLYLLTAICTKDLENTKLQTNNHLLVTNLRRFCANSSWDALKVLVPTVVLVSVLHSKGHDAWVVTLKALSCHDAPLSQLWHTADNEWFSHERSQGDLENTCALKKID